ncbi:MAG: hypothetical protein Q9214_001820, partial [Letrouitia sp. 1 TL-2023]
MEAKTLYEDKSYLVMIAVGCAVAITCLAVTLRLLARRLQKVPLGADDYVIMVGAATYAGYQTYGVAITLIKLSVLLFYQRIFSTPQFRLRTNIFGGLVVAWLFINNFMAAFQCRPIRKAWSPLTPGRCIDTLSLIIGLQAGNLFLDIVILTLPVHAVSQLQMSLAKKISVAAIFLLDLSSSPRFESSSSPPPTQKTLLGIRELNPGPLWNPPSRSSPSASLSWRPSCMAANSSANSAAPSLRYSPSHRSRGCTGARRKAQIHWSLKASSIGSATGGTT